MTLWSPSASLSSAWETSTKELSEDNERLPSEGSSDACFPEGALLPSSGSLAFPAAVADCSSPVEGGKNTETRGPGFSLPRSSFGVLVPDPDSQERFPNTDVGAAAFSLGFEVGPPKMPMLPYTGEVYFGASGPSAGTGGFGFASRFSLVLSGAFEVAGALAGSEASPLCFSNPPKDDLDPAYALNPELAPLKALKPPEVDAVVAAGLGDGGVGGANTDLLLPSTEGAPNVGVLTGVAGLEVVEPKVANAAMGGVVSVLL